MFAIEACCVSFRGRSAGTPTPSSGGTMSLSYLQPLLAFMHQQPYGSQGTVWQEAVQVGRRRLP